MKNILRKEGGFTLIELLVVILIIAILIAVAAPSFLGQTGKAHDSAAKQYLAVAHKAAKAATVTEAAQGEYDQFSAASLVAEIEASEPQTAATVSNLAGGYAAANVDDAPGMDVALDGEFLVLVTESKSGKIFELRADENGGVPAAITQKP